MNEKETIYEEASEDKEQKLEDEWLIRECKFYEDEYSDCTSIKARFNQYFIFGKSIDCSQWKKDSINCYKWFEEQDSKAGNELIQSEKNRRKERLLPHYSNNVWTKRTKPPENWNAPLPEHLQREYEHSYLYVKSKELKGEIPPQFDPNVKYCTIL